MFPNIKFLTGSIDAVLKLKEAGIYYQNVYILDLGKKYSLGAIKVKLEHLYHDTMNCALKFEINDKKGIYAVDTERIDHIEAKNYDLYLIESNYNEELLQEHINNCDDENLLYYLNRVPKTHLSDAQCNDFLLNNMGKNSEFIKIHKSSYNYKEID